MSLVTATSLSHLKFRHLMLIDYLIALGTLHKAARALHISQPAATAMLNDLEALLGVTLFERSHRGVKPTEFGQQLMDGLRTLLNEYKNFTELVERHAHGSSHGRDRVLRVGLVPQAFVTYLPQTIQQFRALGGCAIRAQEGTAAQLLELLWDGQLDGVVSRLPTSSIAQRGDKSALCFDYLYAENICIVAGQKLIGINPTAVNFEWLAQQQWVLQRPDSSVRQSLNEAFLRHGLAPPLPVVETNNYLQSLALVNNTNFLTVAPRRAAQSRQTPGSFEVLDINLGVVPMHVSFICRATSKDNRQLQAFKDCFKRVVLEEATSNTDPQLS